MDDFYYNESYDFIGTFWLENDFKNRFSGIVKYTPETGIKLSLTFTTKTKDKEAELLYKCGLKKLYGAVQTEDKIVDITLLDIVLTSNDGSYRKNSNTIKLSGEAKYLIKNIHLKNEKIIGLNIEYDRYFKSVFFNDVSPENISEVESYTNKQLITQNGMIALSIYKSWSPILHSDNFDNIFCTNHFQENKEKANNARKQIIEILKENHRDLGLIDNFFSIIKFNSKEPLIESLFNNEHKWRTFFELLLDRPISITRSWLSIEYEKTKKRKYTIRKPLLCKQDVILISNKIQTNDISYSKAFLPITIDSFKGENNLSRIQNIYEKWDTLFDNKIWEMVFKGVNTIIYKKHNISLDDFIMLISYIETVLYLLRYEKNDVDTLLKLYIDKNTKDKLDILLQSLPSGTLAEKIMRLRNAISHPISLNKDKGKYLSILNNDKQIQQIYACLSALLIKVILTYLYKFDDKTMNRYVEKFVYSRMNIDDITYYDSIDEYLKEQYPNSY